MKNIFLIGYMGTGKSTVASFLCDENNRDIVEMDETIEKQKNMSISDMFQRYGEAYFRDAESELLRTISMEENKVVSCGGGIVLRKENVALMRKTGIVILLSARPETILKRVKDDTNRPLLQGNKNLEYIREMMESRREKYEKAAEYIIETDDKTIEEICSEILKKVGEEEK